MTRVRGLLLCCLLMLPLAFSVSQNTTPQTSLSTPLLYTVARDYQPLAWIQGGDRFPDGASISIQQGISRKHFIPSFAATADPNVSFDGKNVLFSGKRNPIDHWQVWEVSAIGGKPRQITRCQDDCIRPLYVPPDRFVYAHRIAGKFVLEIVSLNDAPDKPLQLTRAPGNFLPLDVLRDGRVLFEAAYPLDENTLPELYTVYTDGSGVESYRCDHGHDHSAGKQLSSGDIVFARDGSLYRFTSALAHEVAIPSPAGVYAGDVAEAANSTWLVSWRGASQKNFELRSWKPSESALRAVIAESDRDVLQPVLLASRTIPNRHPSGLHDWTYANVLCLNAYTSKYRFAEGAIASVRLYTRDAFGATRLLGTSQVEKDGSFYLRVPGDRPLKIELLDGAGATLKKEAGWFWLRPGEQRICVGCHAGPETAPENAVPAVLLRSTVAADLTGANPSQSAGAH